MNEGKHREFIIGLVALIALLVVIFLTLQIRGMPLMEGSYEVDVRFKEVAGTLIKGASIFVYGVRVGEVTDIAIEPDPVLFPEHPVRLTLRLRKSMVIYENAQVEVMASTIIGETTVVVTPGAPPTPQLEEGTIILGKEPVSIFEDIQEVAPEILFQIAESVTLVNQFLRDLNEHGMVAGAVQDLSSILSHVEESLSSGDGSLQSTLTDIQEFAAHLNSSLDLFDETLIQMSTDLTDMADVWTESIATVETDTVQTMTHFDELLTKLDRSAAILEGTLSENSESWTAITQRAESISLQIENVLSDIENGEGSLGLLLTDESFHTEVTDFFANLNSWLLQVDAIVTGVETPPEQRSIPHLAPTEVSTP